MVVEVHDVWRLFSLADGGSRKSRSHARPLPVALELLRELAPNSSGPTASQYLTTEEPPLASADNDDDALQLLEANHLVAIAYLRLGYLQHARSSCVKARRERRQRRDRDITSRYRYYESTALMAAIVSAEGEPDDADNMLMAIDDDCKEEIIQAIAAATKLLQASSPPRNTDRTIESALSRKQSEEYSDVQALGLGIVDTSQSPGNVRKARGT